MAWYKSLIIKKLRICINFKNQNALVLLSFYLNVDNSINKSSLPILHMITEGTMSQVFHLGYSY